MGGCYQLKQCYTYHNFYSNHWHYTGMVSASTPTTSQALKSSWLDILLQMLPHSDCDHPTSTTNIILTVICSVLSRPTATQSVTSHRKGNQSADLPQ